MQETRPVSSARQAVIDMKLADLLEQGAAPIVAILRGLRPVEAVDVGRALVEAGIRLIEVPLNSPEPLISIERLNAEFASEALIGAGTVLTASAVEAVAQAGGRLIVAPNTEPTVITRAHELGLDCLPGFLSATEALCATRLGATSLKLFPASVVGTAYLKAIREVLPGEVEIWAVGGVGPQELPPWLAAGARGVGVGGSLYRPGDSAVAVAIRAAALVAAWKHSAPPTGD